MAITGPTNPHNNRPPLLLTQDNYVDPYTVTGSAGIPQSVYDTIQNDCLLMMKDDVMGFLDEFSMTKSFVTNTVEYVETTTRDNVIDDDGAVTRTGDVFTIDWTAVEGYDASQEHFTYKVDTTIFVVDGTKMEQGVITAVDIGAATITAKCANGASWTIATSVLTLGTIGGDFDRGSCGPEGTLENRKTTNRFVKLATTRVAMQSNGGERYAWLYNGAWQWYDDNTKRVRKLLNSEVAKKLLISIQSADSSGAHAIGKYGTEGLFENIRANGAVQSGYITDLAGMQAVTDYWDELGMTEKVFLAKVDKTQYRHFEQIAKEVMSNLGAITNVDVNNNSENFAKFGYNTLEVDGYTIHFAKWGLTEGNSPFGKARIIDVFPKGVIIPMGSTMTKINGIEQSTPYIFKAYQVFPEHNQNGMVREVITGAFAPTPTNDCEYEKLTLSTTTGIIIPCPEPLVIID